MNFHSFEPRSRSWMYITCVVVAIHTFSIGWAVLFDAPAPIRQQNSSSRLVVQTIALKSNPIPRNPIPRTPILPAQLERKKMEPTPIPAIPIKQPDLEETIVNPMPPPPAPKAPPPEPPAPPKPAVKQPPAKPLVKPAPKPHEVKKVPAVPKKPEPHKNDIYIQSNAQKAAAEKAAADQKKKQESEAIKKKDTEKLAERERQQKLVAMAQESIAKISGSSDKGAPKREKSTLSAVPNAIANLEADSLAVPKGAPGISHREVTDRDELASRLKVQLRLPEYGDVKINLTLDRAGKVLKVEIISAESKANRSYVEKTLPGLTFPSFGGNFESATQYTFPITLSNE